MGRRDDFLRNFPNALSIQSLQIVIVLKTLVANLASLLLTCVFVYWAFANWPERKIELTKSFILFAWKVFALKMFGWYKIKIISRWLIQPKFIPFYSSMKQRHHKINLFIIMKMEIFWKFEIFLLTSRDHMTHPPRPRKDHFADRSPGGQQLKSRGWCWKKNRRIEADLKWLKFNTNVRVLPGTVWPVINWSVERICINGFWLI